MTTYVYADAYLKGQVTDDREARALADVNAIATFSADWVARLTILRAYILTCLECQAQPDDLFAQKLGHYRKEWDARLADAKAATLDDDGLPMPAFTVPLERA